MNRRTVLRYLATLPFAAATPRFLHRAPHRASFFVAGARFFPRHDELRAGDLVLLEWRTVKGKDAYAICDVAGRQIGWVPRRLISAIASAPTQTARLTTVAPDGVPWRWYRVEIAS
ncbi:MAG TPA: hypothetical protein VLC46_10580 [Thermoanaerobaculia bacterium]|jgi:hypothetical protein|nr:hypothetical protein [Thermoanaerobaculia bacterium]